MGRLHHCGVVALLVVCAMAGAGIVHAQTGVQFDGTNDYITFGTAPGLGASNFTLELWFYRTGTGATTTTGTGGVTAIPLLTKGRGEAEASTVDMNYFMGIRSSDNVLCADYEEGTGQTSPGLNHPVAGVTPIRNNTWYHAAATFDGTTWRLYLNGNLEATSAVGAGRLPQSASIQHAGIASAMTSAGVAQGFFAGVIDEARVWNIARTPQEINDNMLVELGTAAGLIGRWGLNDATSTTAVNSTGGVNGTLTNGPTWVPGSPFAIENSLKLGSNAAAYVTFGDPNELDLPQFTLETWFRRDGAGTSASTGSGGVTAIPLVTHGGAETEASNVDMNYYLGIRASDNVLCADFEEGAGGASPSLNHPIAGVTSIASGTWYHAAVTYDGNTWRLYLNGALEATLAVNQPVASASTQHAGLGVMLTSTGAASGHFDGALDETRVWNTARTVSEINATVNSKLSSPTPGLVARWALDEGAGSAVKGSAGTAVNGTVQGTGWSWDVPAPFNAAPPSVPADPTGLSAAGTTFHRIDLTWTDASNNETAFEIERSTDSGGSFAALATVAPNVTTYADRNLTAASEYIYRVRATNISGSSNWSNLASVITPVESDHAIDFGGTNGYVTFGDPAQLDLAQFTLETWFRRDGAGVTANTGTGGGLAIPLVTKGVGEAEGSNVDMNYFLGIRGSDNVLFADFEEGAGGAGPQGQNHPIAGTTPITNGVWHHVAATYDGTTWNLYLDGVLEATLAVGQPVQSASIQHAALATAINSTGVNQGYFDGVLDEVRIWNYARSLGQIRSTINTAVTTATTGLVARWSLNEGAANDVAGSSGTAVAGTLTGSNWSWTTETAPYNVVVNDPPSAVLTGPAHHASNVPLSPTLDVTVSDPEADSVTVSFYGRTQSPVSGTPVSLVIIPDSQYYTSEQNGATAAMLNAQLQWVVDNVSTRHIAFVDHVGDITDHGDAYEVEWTRAADAMALIENPLTTGLTDGVPFCMTIGNHDQLPSGATTFYNQYFGASHFAGRAYYGGHYGATNNNNFTLFNGGGLDFIAINMEYDTAPDAPVLAWADSLLKAYPGRWAILSVHNTINAGNPGSWAAQGSATYEALKNNPNLFLMVSGHVPGEGRRSDTYGGRTVHTLLADYQSRANGGSGWMRIVTLYPAEGVMRVKTYSPVLGQFEADADSSSQFTLPISLAPVSSWQLIGSRKVASGDHATLGWPGLSAFANYEWHVNVDDGITNVDGPTWSFTTGSAAPVVAVTSPNGGETLVKGQNGTIRWNATDDFGVTSVDVLLSRTGAAGVYEVLASGLSNSGSYDWIATEPVTTDAFVKVVAHDAENNASHDLSDAAFTIDAPVAIGMKSVSARADGGDAVIRWQTQFESEVDGFRILRSNAQTGVYVPVSADLIDARGGVRGASYEYRDTAIRPNQTYWYKLVEVTPDGDMAEFGPYSVTVRLANSLDQNMPNPFNPVTTIRYSIAQDAHVSLIIYDVAGRQVRSLVDTRQRADVYRVTWDGTDDHGAQVASGVYFSRLVAGKFVETRKISLVK